MSILNYVSSLLPRFKKDRVMEEVQITLAELDNVCIASYAEAAKADKIVKILSPEVKEYTTIYSRITKLKGGDSLISSIYSKLLLVKENLKLLENKLDKELQDDVVSEGLSVLKASIIQAVEASYFISKFSTKLLNAIYVYETAERTENKAAYIKENIAPAELDYVKQKFSDFCFVLDSLCKNKNDLDKILAAIPDIAIRSDNFAAIGATLSREKTDPFSLKDFVRGFSGNPIFHIGMMVAEWQARRYKKNAELKKVLELRLLNLKELNADVRDAKIEREIQYIQNRIEDLEYSMSKMEQE